MNSEPLKKLVIIDGKSVFYRGYFAMGTLSKKDGTPTSGVYGFAVIAMEIVRRLGPDKVVVAWDKAHTSTRKRLAIYPEYKAGRVKPPQDFYDQIPLLVDLIRALGWGFLECDDYEADDIIGTLARQADEAGGWETIIVSSDLDMLQIVDENTRMYRLLRGFSKLEEMDVPAVEAKYGISKKQFLDLKALKGDSSDNIPGVPGVGEKTAANLLSQYESLDGIYEHIDEIKGSVHDKLVAGKESAYMSYKLAKIDFSAPVSLAEVPDFKIDKARILKALNYLEFYSLVRKFEIWLSNLGTSFSGSRPSGLSLHGSAAMLRQQAAGFPEKDIPKDLIVAYDIKKLMHEKSEVAEKILAGAKFYDLGQGRFLLDPLTRVVDEELSEQEEYWRQQEEFKKYPELHKVLLEYDLPLIPVLYKMEKTGVLIDREYFANLRGEFEKQVQEIEQKIYTIAGEEFNLNSPIQLSEVLYGKLGLPTKGIKKTSRGYSTGAKELAKLATYSPVIPLIMEYREASKLLSTYILPLPELADKDSRVHTTFTQNVTATGRLSSVNPNLQNIPVRTGEGKRIRTGFVAGSGRCLVSADYSQFELRLAAALSGDEALISDFNSGIDIHTKTASDVFHVPMGEVTKAQRRAAKTINFGVLYGMSAKGLADAAKMNFMEAKKFIEDYFEVRKPIREYLDKVLAQARNEGYVSTFYGRRRPTPDVKSSNFVVRMGAERAAQNMLIQGTEADLMKRAMIRVDSLLPAGAELVLQIHDSWIVECACALADEVSKILARTMEGIAPEMPVKLAVEVTKGKNWGEL